MAVGRGCCEVWILYNMEMANLCSLPSHVTVMCWSCDLFLMQVVPPSHFAPGLTDSGGRGQPDGEGGKVTQGPSQLRCNGDCTRDDQEGVCVRVCMCGWCYECIQYIVHAAHMWCAAVSLSCPTPSSHSNQRYTKALIQLSLSTSFTS